MIVSALLLLAASAEPPPPVARAVARAEARILEGRVIDFREARPRKPRRDVPAPERRLIEFE